MTATQYKALRSKLGTQEEVAAMLGVKRLTIIRRERSKGNVAKEAAAALKWLANKKKS